MTRTILNYGLAVLLTLLAAAPFGCAPKDPNAAQDPAKTEAAVETPLPTVNYSMAQPVKLQEIRSRQQFDDFLKDHEIAVVKMGATWCPPCRQLTPELEKMAGYFQTENVGIGDIDVDHFDELAREMKVESIPFTAVYYNGNFMHSIVGFEPGSIASLIDSLCQRTVDARDEEAENGADEPEGDDDGFELEVDDPDDEPSEPQTVRNNGYEAPDGPYSQSEPIEMTPIENLDALDKFCAEHKYVVVEFGADWCIWCKRLHPEVAKMGGFYQDKEVAIAEVDTEVAKDVAGKYRVGGIPHTFFFLDGEEYTNVLGCNPLKINAAIEAMLNGDPAPEPDAPGAGGDGEDDAEEDVDKDAEDEAVDLEFDDEEDAGAEEQDDAE